MSSDLRNIWSEYHAVDIPGVSWDWQGSGMAVAVIWNHYKEVNDSC